MKTFTRIILLFAIAVFSSCEGPMGPQGIPGEDGEDGGLVYGQIFEIEGDFTEANDHTLYYEFPSGFEIYTTDIVMVYILWDKADYDGEIVNVWRALPQTVVLDEGVIQYNFDYTVYDVQVFIEETVGELLPEETDNQKFRIAVIPAEDALALSVDISDLNAVMKSMNMPDSAVEQISVTK